MLFRSTYFLKKKSLQNFFLELLELYVRKYFKQFSKILNTIIYAQVLYFKIIYKL